MNDNQRQFIASLGARRIERRSSVGETGSLFPHIKGVSRPSPTRLLAEEAVAQSRLRKPERRSL
jgi:hypothetical protein